MKELIPHEVIEKRIFLIRGQKVMLGLHLAELYGVETRALNQAVKRNINRFPEDFTFQLNNSESEWLVSQNVIPHKKYFGGSFPYAFTEQGVAMLSSVLNSDRAVQVNIQIMRTFTKLRQILATHEDVKRKLEEHDKQFIVIFAEINRINKLLEPPKPLKKKKYGFLK